MNIVHPKIESYLNGSFRIFDTIGIETSEYCNRTCEFCPNSINRQKRRKMSEKIYFSMIDQLKEIEYSGSICFNQYNEPLLDNRLDKFIFYARSNLPNSTLTISTNGDALTLKRWNSLRHSGLNFAIVSQYDGIISKKIQNLINVVNNENYLKVEVRGSHNLKSTRCGLVNLEYQNNTSQNQCCLRPFSQLVIRYNGLAVLCCEDYFLDTVVGDTNTDKLLEIWNGKKLEKIRNSLITGKRSGICMNCNISFESSVDSCEFIAISR